MRDQAIRYLIVPGWQGSAEDHWQSHWQRVLPGSERLEQRDWLTPRRADWVAALDACIARDPRPTLLIAHSLGCITVAHWAASAPAEHLARLRGALLGAGREGPLLRTLVVQDGVAETGKVQVASLGQVLVFLEQRLCAGEVEQAWQAGA